MVPIRAWLPACSKHGISYRRDRHRNEVDRSKIEQAVLDPEIVQAKKDVTRALADSEHGWDRAQVLIGEDAGLRKGADGTWSQPADANAAA